MSAKTVFQIKGWEENALWILGFLFSYFLFSTVISLVFFRDEEMAFLWGMGVTMLVLAGGEFIKRRLK